MSHACIQEPKQSSFRSWASWYGRRGFVLFFCHNKTFCREEHCLDNSGVVLLWDQFQQVDDLFLTYKRTKPDSKTWSQLIQKVSFSEMIVPINQRWERDGRKQFVFVFVFQKFSEDHMCRYAASINFVWLCFPMLIRLYCMSLADVTSEHSNEMCLDQVQTSVISSKVCRT